MSDARWMALALELGRRGLGRVWPNPSVGCVIVKDGRVVGRGWTQDGGRPHAETHALAAAGTAARGSDVYVTLEPCSHHGHTPPCAQALIDAGVSRVIVAAGDSDPRVSGRGYAMLRDAGICVDIGLCEAEARNDLAGFFKRIETGRPWVTLKLANSFDGRIATASGDSQWITGADARRHVHMSRARHDAVMVGAGTVRADNPSLNVRDLGVARQPIRVVLSRKLDLPTDCKLAVTAGDPPVWILHSDDASQSRIEDWTGHGANCLAAGPEAHRQLDPSACLQTLGAQGLTRVYCEGGGALAASLLGAGLIDEVIGYTAGVAIGAEGTPSLGALGLSVLAEAPRFQLLETRAIGADVLHRWRPL